MIDLALREHNGPVTLAGSASGRRFLFHTSSSCLASCVATNWSKATRGPGWRYTLGRVAKEHHGRHIIAVDEPLDANPVRRQGKLPRRPAVA